MMIRQRYGEEILFFILIWTSKTLSSVASNVPITADIRPPEHDHQTRELLDTETCYEGLFAADVNLDGKVDREEYVTFIQSVAPGPHSTSQATSFADLLLPQQITFNTLACMCEARNGDDMCCVGDKAGISIQGADPNVIPSPDDASRLFLVCWLSSEAVDLAMVPGTSSPIPTVVLPPSSSPSSVPTIVAQQTPAPTKRDSRITTDEPGNNTTTAPRTRAPTWTPIVGNSTVAPTPFPTFRPTERTPTKEENMDTQPPTMGTSGVVGLALYSIIVRDGVRDNIPTSFYEPKLIDAMDVLALELVAEIDSQEGNLRRKLRIQADLPTSVDKIVDAGGFTDAPELIGGVFQVGLCPETLGDPVDDRCEQVWASIVLLLDAENPLLVQQAFQSSLDRSISSGRLIEIFQELHPDSVVDVITGVTTFEDRGVITQAPTLVDEDEQNRALSVGATAGLVVAILAGCCIVVAFFLKRESEEKVEMELQEQAPPPATGLEWGEKQTKHQLPFFHSHIETPKFTPEGTADTPLAAYSQPQAKMIQPPDESLEPFSGLTGIRSFIRPYRNALNDREMGDDGSSAGGSKSKECYETISAWSDAFTSSMGSMESDELLLDTPMIDLNSEIDMIRHQSHPGIVDFDDLETAINMGDWAAVGESASLLAASQYDTTGSLNSRSRSTFNSRRSKSMSLDLEKAAELDALIEEGDWEGVILAAARFEAESASEVNFMEGEGSLSSGAVAGSRHSGSAATASLSTLNEKTAESRSLEEIRRDVVHLAARVVPEELDHLDEMMAQFEGREEELVETLQTMEERSKAKTASSSRARIQATEQEGEDQKTPANTQAGDAQTSAYQTDHIPAKSSTSLYSRKLGGTGGDEVVDEQPSSDDEHSS